MTERAAAYGRSRVNRSRALDARFASREPATPARSAEAIRQRLDDHLANVNDDAPQLTQEHVLNCCTAIAAAGDFIPQGRVNKKVGKVVADADRMIANITELSQMPHGLAEFDFFLGVLILFRDENYERAFVRARKSGGSPSRRADLAMARVAARFAVDFTRRGANLRLGINAPCVSLAETFFEIATGRTPRNMYRICLEERRRRGLLPGDPDASRRGN